MSEEANIPSPSQVIEDRPTNEVPRPGDLPEVETPKEAPKPLSTREAITKAFDEAAKPEKEEPAEKAAKAAPAPEKAGADEKTPPARAEDGKFARAQSEETPTAPTKPSAVDMEAEKREAAGKPYAEPPERFLPRAKEMWANVPNAVKADLHRVMQEADTETAKYRESAEAFETVRRFHDMARQAGTTLDKALDRYVRFDELLQRNPTQGIAEILRSIGVTPQQYAQHVLQNPQAHVAPARTPAPQQTQPNPEIQTLRAEIEQLKQQHVAESARPIVESFAHGRADFAQLQPAIAEILGSGILDKLYGAGLTPEQRLEEAYRMAGGRYASSPAASLESHEAHSAPPASRPVDPDGQKSIKGAPTAGQLGQNQRRFKSNREALEAAFAAASR